MTSLPCPPAQWPRFSALLDAAMELPEDARATWLDGLAGEDASVRPWLVRVLRGETGAETDFLCHGPDMVPEDGFAAGTVVGPYRLESRLGEGGMGEVWRAQRLEDGPRREVALKLPHAELLGGPFRARFARERDVLAALSHPHIAQLYDAGLSAEGHPYLALELVEGSPITEACRAEAASLARRVVLIRQVLGALSYAHQRLIVHRDIKPSNVLVTPEGGVKLLDFGIAKLLRPSETQDTRLTQVAGRLATPAYAAPEQLCDGAITVATDVFSVGVLLFELCTGRRPFATAPLGPNAAPAPLASQRADAAAAGLPDGRRLARALRGDMDAVIAKALALDPAARYSSAEAFARDLARCRDGLPVSARRIGWAARAQKFAARNKVGVSLASVLALAVAGGTAGVAWQAQRAAREAARAEHEAARANAVKDYLLGLFEQGDPHQGGKPSETMTVRELLDAGADRADTAFANQPETELELLDALAQIFEALEDPLRVRKFGMRRLELARQLYGPTDPRVLDGTMKLASSQGFFLDHEAARALLESIRAPVFSQYGPESLQRADWLDEYAKTLRTTHGGRDEALADSLAAVAIFAKHFPDNPDYSDALYILAGYQYDAEQYSACLDSLNRARAILAAHADKDALMDLMYDTQAGGALRRLGRLDEAEKLFLDAQETAEKVVGRQSMWHIAALTYRANLADSEGKRTQALALFGEAMAAGGSKSASTGQLTALLRAYGAALANEGDAAAAIPLLETALKQTTERPRDEANQRYTEGYLGDAYDKAGRAAAARGLLQAARDEWVRYGVPAGPQTLVARERWARFLLEHGDADAATTELRTILQLAGDAKLGALAMAHGDLARIALARGDSAAADTESAAAMHMLDAATPGYDVRNRPDVWMARAEVLLARGHKPQAADLATRALAAARDYDAPASPRIARAIALMGRIARAG